MPSLQTGMSLEETSKRFNDQEMVNNNNNTSNDYKNDDNLSSYSHDSERWIHFSGQTPDDLTVPEPAYYIPPDEKILRSIKRPSSSIVSTI